MLCGNKQMLHIFNDQGSQIRQIWRILRQNCSDDSTEVTEGVTSTPKSFDHIIHVNSPGYGADLPLSRTGHQISRIKSSFELFCALVRDLAQVKLKTSIFLIRSTVSGAFLNVFSHSQRLLLASKR